MTDADAPVAPRLLTIKEAAAIARMPQFKLATLIAQGSGPPVSKLGRGGRCLVPEDTLRRWMDGTL